ncbi:acetate/propionate family kinase [Flavobacteriaceae bacterium Ap0902]|nr:acetate/propionate family kinase [Flavobacteriaceae bacterium Ap0902]
MKILVLNSGSSSIKFQVIEKPENIVLATGLVEKIGLVEGAIHYKTGSYNTSLEIKIPDHKFGLRKVVNLLLDEKVGVLGDVSEIAMVGHRVVHGGKDFTATTYITDKVKNKIRDLFDLAPLHNPPNLNGIEVAEEIFPNAKQVAVFDTSFHQTLPEKSYTYAIPMKFRDENNIRLYGFHGISHKYVSEEANKLLNADKSKIITIHLGNGCSMTAVENGKSIEHSLGFSPNEGLVMGTRSGAIDSGIIFHLIEVLGYTPQEVNLLLSKKSGMLGLTGYSDLREIEQKASEGDRACQLALEINAYRIKKLIGAYAVVMNGLDAIIFTAGIGENSEVIRNMVCENMDFLGIKIDIEKNSLRSKEIREISERDSKVKIFVIPTNEELEIANEAYNLFLR